MQVIGDDSGLFSIDKTNMSFQQNACEKVRISFKSPTSLSTSQPVDAFLKIGWIGTASSGSIPKTTTIQLILKDYNFEAQILDYPPPPTLPPTMPVTPFPTVMTSVPTTPTGATTLPVSNPSTTEPSSVSPFQNPPDGFAYTSNQESVEGESFTFVLNESDSPPMNGEYDSGSNNERRSTLLSVTFLVFVMWI